MWVRQLLHYLHILSFVEGRVMAPAVLLEPHKGGIFIYWAAYY